MCSCKAPLAEHVKSLVAACDKACALCKTHVLRNQVLHTQSTSTSKSLLACCSCQLAPLAAKTPAMTSTVLVTA